MELFEFIWSILGHIVRFLGYLIIDVFFETIISKIGYYFIKLVTLGSFPKKDYEKNDNKFPVMLLGLALFMIGVLFVIIKI